MGWIASLFLTRQTLSSALGVIDIRRAALHTRAFVVAEILFFAVLCLLPIAATSAAFRARLKIWRTAAARLGLALGLANLILGGLVLWEAFRFSERAEDMLIFSTATQGFVISLIVMLVTRVLTFEERQRGPDEGRRGEAVFRVLLAAICLGYIVLASRVVSSRLVDNYPDTLAYLSIARQYAEGSPVIRGYWSPLTIWVMVPLLRFGVNGYVAYRALAVFFGLIWIPVSVILARRLGLGRGFQLVLAGSVGLLIIGAGLGHGLPDLVGAFFLAIYFIVLLRPDYLERPVRNGLLTGVLGALAYLAKYYNLTFVLVHLAIITALRIASGAPRKAAARALISGALTLLVASLPWATVLSFRYHRLVFNTTGALNHAIMGPSMTDHPCNGARLCAEPEDVLFTWEDPAEVYYPDLGWSPLASVENLRHELRLIGDHLRLWVPSASFFVGPIPGLGLVGAALLALKTWLNPKRRFLPAWIALTCGPYLAGYLPFLSTFRHNLAVVPLLFIGVYLSLARLVGQAPFHWRSLRGAVAALNGALTVALVLISMARPPVLRYLLTERSPYACLETDSLALEGIVDAPLAGTDWQVIHVGFHTRTRTLGWLNPETAASLVDQELRTNSVRSFLALEGADLTEELVRDYGYTIRGPAAVCENAYLVLVPPSSP
jgi:hypothetical protein